MILQHRATRRAVLKGLGAFIALPWLESLARAAETKPPVRLGFVYVPNGVHSPRWHLEAAGRIETLSPALQPLSDFKTDILTFRGLALDQSRGHGDVGGDHARATASFLTAAHCNKSDGRDLRVNGISVDQIAAAKLGRETRLPSLELACDYPLPPGACEHGYSLVYRGGLSWRSSTSILPVEYDPQAVFTRLFGQSKTIQGAGQDASVLDLVLEESHLLERKLGGQDKRKLDEYLHSVRAVEQRLQRAQQMPPKALPTNARRPAQLPLTTAEHIDAMLDLLVLAFQTDSTRVASVMLALGGSNRAFPELGLTSGHHGYSHHGGKQSSLDALHTIDQFYAERFAILLRKLKAIPEGNGTLLDNCLLLYGSPMNDGNGHTRDNLPILLGGRGGGAIEPGRSIVYTSETPLANLFLNMLDAAGIKEPRFSDSTGRLAL